LYKKMNVVIEALKKYCLFILLSISCLTIFTYPEIDGEFIVFFPAGYQTPADHGTFNNHTNYGIRTTNHTSSYQQNSYYATQQRSCGATVDKIYYTSWSPADFQRAFQNATDQAEILSNYPLYAFPHFLEFARTLPCYDAYILELNYKIQHDKNFKKQTANIPYFEYEFGLRREISGFHNFITAEAQRIIAAQEQRAAQLRAQQQKLIVVEKKGVLQVNNLETLLHSCTENNVITSRSAERIDAINQTQKNNAKSFDYSQQVAHLNADDPDAIFRNTFGTQLDCQLHKELCQTRSSMRHLERTYHNSPHVQILAPVVYRYTAQAKKESSPLVAFELSNFCHTITQVLAHGMHVLYDASCAIGKGAWKGIDTVTSIEHWKGMVTGPAELALFFMNEMVQAEILQDIADQAVISGDFHPYTVAIEERAVREEIINKCIQETRQKISAMSWQDHMENVVEIGTTIILDIVTFNLLNATGNTLGNCIKQLNNAIDKGVLFRPQYAVEVAGFGKLIVEQGIESSVGLATLIEENIAHFAKSTKPISQEIRNKALQTALAKKIRSVDDDILDIMEKAGGHTLEQHVSKTCSDLSRRIAKSRFIKIASSFTTKRTALQAIKKSLRRNAEEIASWFTNSTKDQMVLEFSYQYPIGTAMLNKKKNPLYNLTYLRIILRRDLTNEFGFKILTAFPIKQLTG
jgi:hypothetical protein